MAESGCRGPVKAMLGEDLGRRQRLARRTRCWSRPPSGRRCKLSGLGDKFTFTLPRPDSCDEFRPHSSPASEPRIFTLDCLNPFAREVTRSLRFEHRRADCARPMSSKARSWQMHHHVSNSKRPPRVVESPQLGNLARIWISGSGPVWVPAPYTLGE
jgi:hypothetical protein